MKAKVIFKNPIKINKIERCFGDIIELNEDNMRALVRASIVEPIEEDIEEIVFDLEPSQEVLEESNQDIELKFIKEQIEEVIVKKTRKKRGIK